MPPLSLENIIALLLMLAGACSIIKGLIRRTGKLVSLGLCLVALYFVYVRFF